MIAQSLRISGSPCGKRRKRRWNWMMFEVAAYVGQGGEEDPDVQMPAEGASGCWEAGPAEVAAGRCGGAHVGEEVVIGAVEHPPQRRMGLQIRSRGQGRGPVGRLDAKTL
jgi:hypothetical protein